MTPSDEKSFILNDTTTSDEQNNVEMKSDGKVDDGGEHEEVNEKGNDVLVEKEAEDVTMKSEEEAITSDEPTTQMEELESKLKPTLEMSNVDLDDSNRTKDVTIDDEYMDKADSPEYPVISNNPIETDLTVAMTTEKLCD